MTSKQELYDEKADAGWKDEDASISPTRLSISADWFRVRKRDRVVHAWIDWS